MKEEKNNKQHNETEMTLCSCCSYATAGGGHSFTLVVRVFFYIVFVHNERMWFPDSKSGSCCVKTTKCSNNLFQEWQLWPGIHPLFLVTRTNLFLSRFPCMWVCSTSSNGGEGGGLLFLFRWIRPNESSLSRNTINSIQGVCLGGEDNTTRENNVPTTNNAQPYILCCYGGIIG